MRNSNMMASLQRGIAGVWARKNDRCADIDSPTRNERFIAALDDAQRRAVLNAILAAGHPIPNSATAD